MLPTALGGDFTPFLPDLPFPIQSTKNMSHPRF
jgi:hypothetical protein